MGFNTPYGYNFTAEGNGTYGLGELLGAGDDFWSRPTNYDQWANPSFGVENLTPGRSTGTSSGNPFGNMFKSGFGASPPMSPMGQFNMAGMLAASAGIAGSTAAMERQKDYEYGNLARTIQHEENLNNWFKYGPHLAQQKQNIEQRGKVSDGVLSRAFMSQGITDAMKPNSWSAQGGLNSALPRTRLV